MIVGAPYSGDALVERHLRATRRLALTALLVCLAISTGAPYLAREWDLVRDAGIAPYGAAITFVPLALLVVAALAMMKGQQRLVSRFGIEQD